MHGDIKPDNLLVTQNGTVKIGDFSVSQVFEVTGLLKSFATLILVLQFYFGKKVLGDIFEAFLFVLVLIILPQLVKLAEI